MSEGLAEEGVMPVQGATSSGAVWSRFRHFLCGSFAGMANLIVGHPIDLVKVRLQTEGKYGRFTGAMDCIKQTLKNEGFAAFYKGLTPPMIGKGIVHSCVFGIRNYALELCNQTSLRERPILKEFICGALTGCAVTLVVTPIDQLKVALQVQYHSTRNSNSNGQPGERLYTGPIDCAKKLIAERGVWGGLYKFTLPTMLEMSTLGFYFANYTFALQQIQQWQSKEENKVSNATATFIAGGLAGLAMTVTAYPFEVVKNRLMTQGMTLHKQRYLGMRDCARSIYRTEGWRSFFRGLAPACLRTVPTSGATFLAYEFAQRILPQ